MIHRFPRDRIIVNIRGSNGSGKSTIIFKLMKKFKSQPLHDLKTEKIWAYKVYSDPPFFVLGRYETPTGGCDGIKTQDDVASQLKELSKNGNVIFEGLLISGLVSRMIKLTKDISNAHFIFGCMDTPLSKCINRMNRRRKAAGKPKLEDNSNVEAKFRAVKSSAKSLSKAGLDVRIIPHKKAVSTVLQFLGVLNEEN